LQSTAMTRQKQMAANVKIFLCMGFISSLDGVISR
jgi:hypothetical protein